MSSEPTNTVDDRLAGLVALLDRLDRENPTVAAAAASLEVDELLGRTPAGKPAAIRTQSTDGAFARPARWHDPSAFAWYQSVAARLPPVLTQDRMVDAAKGIEVGLLAQQRLDTADRGSMSRKELRDLNYLAGRGRAEYELLIASNLRLVFHWCKGMAVSVGEHWVQDAFQAGCIGLIRAVQGWDYAKGYAFSTYASWHIRQRIQRWRWDETTVVRIPVHVWEKLESRPGELSDALEVAAVRSLNVSSLEDVDPNEPAHFRLGDFEDVEDRLDRANLVEYILAGLDARERDVLSLRHGLNAAYSEPLTLDAIGALYGLTRERIRQVEKKALKRIAADPDIAALRAI